MKKLKLAFLVSAVCMVATTALIVRAKDDDDDLVLRARLSSFQEVGPPVSAPNASTTTGTFHATLSEDGTTLTYKLTWTAFTSPIKFAHIHFAMRGVSGGIMVFLCGGGPTSKPACANGVATGTITAADVINTLNNGNSQGVTAGDFTDFLRVIRSGDGYCNIHTNNFPGGEIRGQIEVVSDRDDQKDWN
jgi:hypothetical protein